MRISVRSCLRTVSLKHRRFAPCSDSCLLLPLLLLALQVLFSFRRLSVHIPMITYPTSSTYPWVTFLDDHPYSSYVEGGKGYSEYDPIPSGSHWEGCDAKPSMSTSSTPHTSGIAASTVSWISAEAFAANYGEPSIFSSLDTAPIPGEIASEAKAPFDSGYSKHSNPHDQSQFSVTGDEWFLPNTISPYHFAAQPSSLDTETPPLCFPRAFPTPSISPPGIPIYQPKPERPIPLVLFDDFDSELANNHVPLSSREVVNRTEHDSSATQPCLDPSFQQVSCSRLREENQFIPFSDLYTYYFQSR
ncbi:hypothetical protein DL96DRAFT_78772 [Flagelloscypha sp. PMI_526]|nr:hypothetical protein DL96DRAFT_78772 [Flagelloscypha sp. PMI_526]